MARTILSLILSFMIVATSTPLMAEPSPRDLVTLDPQGDPSVQDVIVALGIAKGLIGLKMLLAQDLAIQEIQFGARSGAGIAIAAFLAGQTIGYLQMKGTSSSICPIVAESAARFFIDCDQNGAFSDGEMFGDVINGRLFFILTGGLLAAGLYCFSFLPSIFLLDPGVRLGLFTLALAGPALTFTYILTLLIGAAVLAHLPFGRSPAPAGIGPQGSTTLIETAISIGNPTNQSRDGTLRFYSQGGEPLQVPIGGESTDTYEFTIPPHSTLVEDLGSDVPIQVVWATAEGEDLEFATTYTTRSGPGPAGVSGIPAVGNAGLATGTPGTSHSIPVREGGGRKAAFAIANISGFGANLRAILRDSGGVEIETALFNMAQDQQVAMFASDLFETLAPGSVTGDSEFAGSITIESNSTTVVLTLETDQAGFQQASLPSSTYQ